MRGPAPPGSDGSASFYGLLNPRREHLHAAKLHGKLPIPRLAQGLNSLHKRFHRLRRVLHDVRTTPHECFDEPVVFTILVCSHSDVRLRTHHALFHIRIPHPRKNTLMLLLTLWFEVINAHSRVS